MLWKFQQLKWNLRCTISVLIWYRSRKKKILESTSQVAFKKKIKKYIINGETFISLSGEFMLPRKQFFFVLTSALKWTGKGIFFTQEYQALFSHSGTWQYILNTATCEWTPSFLSYQTLIDLFCVNRRQDWTRYWTRYTEVFL